MAVVSYKYSPPTGWPPANTRGESQQDGAAMVELNKAIEAVRA